MNQKPDPDKLAQVVAESAHQIWLAGISAVSLAEKEGGRFFEALSKLGENLQAQTVKTAGVAKKTVSGGKHAASETWDKLEELFELRVGRALNALQIPTARDIKELTARVDKLSTSVKELGAKKGRADRKTGEAKKKKDKKKDKKNTARKSAKAVRKASTKPKAGKKKTKSAKTSKKKTRK